MIENEIHETSVWNGSFKLICADGFLFLLLGELCTFLELDQEQQIQRLRKHTLFSDGIGTNETDEVVIRADLLALWLANLDLTQIKGQMQDELIAYQREAALVLQEALFQGRLTGQPSTAQLIRNNNSPLAKVYGETIALEALIREQLLLETQL